MTDQLQPNPKPGPFTSPVNVNELNRILRTLARRIDTLETASTTEAQATSTTSTSSGPESASSSQEQDEALTWVLS